MWNIDPKLLCLQHLMSEHVQMHMAATRINKNQDLLGYIMKGMIEPHNVVKRHDALAQELDDRGHHHKTPIEITVNIKEEGHVDLLKSIKTLAETCPDCRTRILNSIKKENGQ